MDRCKIHRIQNGSFKENCYLFQINESECFLIDPGLDGAVIQNALNYEKLKPLAILCTHGHFDHIGSVSHFQKLFDCRYYIHKDEIKISKTSNFLLKAFKIDVFIDVPAPDVLITGDEEFTIGNIRIKFIHTPGHTPGSCVIVIGNNMFTGDTLFKNFTESFSLPGQDKNQLADSIQKLGKIIPDDYRIYPGHGDDELFGIVKEKSSKLINRQEKEQEY